MKKLITNLRESGEISTNIPRRKTQQEIDEIAAKYQEDLHTWVLQQKDDCENIDSVIRANYEKFT
jgi:hypothetical protein